MASAPRSRADPRHLGRQSCTTSRTSASTCSSACTISVRRWASVDAAEWYVDEALVQRAPVAPRRRYPADLPDLSPLDREDRCASSCTSSPRSVSSDITESTRNGMSSLSTSITEIDFRCSPALAAATRSGPWGARLARGDEGPGLAAERGELLSALRPGLGRGAAEQQRGEPSARRGSAALRGLDQRIGAAFSSLPSRLAMGASSQTRVSAIPRAASKRGNPERQALTQARAFT